MKYHPPYGSTDPNASYVDKDVPGAVRGSPIPAKAVEVPQREIVNVISKAGKEPADGNQLASAIQSGKLNFSAIGGTANALTMILPEVPASWSDLIGTPLRGIITTTNTGPCTLNVNGLGAKAIKIDNGSNTMAGDLESGSVAVFVYDGASVQIAFSSSMLKNRLNAGATIVTYSTAGSFSWVVPASVRKAFVRLWGAGGGGGGSQLPAAAGGGGGGGYAEGYVDVTPGATVPLLIGSGGAAGNMATGTGYGSTGGSTSFGAFLSATGGGGGERAVMNSQGVSGGGGQGAGGSRQSRGGSGSSGTYVGTSPAMQLGGQGGGTGGGGGGGGGSSSGLGDAGQTPGGGGAGGAGGQPGAAGGNGAIIIEYFV